MSKAFILVTLVMTFFAATVTVNANTQKTTGATWVAVRVIDNVNSMSEYHGVMDKKVFWDFISGKQTNGIFRLQETFAVNAKGEAIPLDKLKISERSLGYSRDVFLRLENLLRIIPLRPDYAQASDD